MAFAVEEGCWVSVFSRVLSGTGITLSITIGTANSIMSANGRGFGVTTLRGGVIGSCGAVNRLFCGRRGKGRVGRRRLVTLITNVSRGGTRVRMLGRRVGGTGSNEIYTTYNTVVRRGAMFYPVYNRGLRFAARRWVLGRAGW